jgi:hypothetical protein
MAAGTTAEVVLDWKKSLTLLTIERLRLGGHFVGTSSDLVNTSVIGLVFVTAGSPSDIPADELCDKGAGESSTASCKGGSTSCTPEDTAVRAGAILSFFSFLMVPDFDFRDDVVDEGDSVSDSTLFALNALKLPRFESLFLVAAPITPAMLRPELDREKLDTGAFEPGKSSSSCVLA